MDLVSLNRCKRGTSITTPQKWRQKTQAASTINGNITQLVITQMFVHNAAGKTALLLCKTPVFVSESFHVWSLSVKYFEKGQRLICRFKIMLNRHLLTPTEAGCLTHGDPFPPTVSTHSDCHRGSLNEWISKNITGLYDWSFLSEQHWHDQGFRWKWTKTETTNKQSVSLVYEAFQNQTHTHTNRRIKTCNNFIWVMGWTFAAGTINSSES